MRPLNFMLAAALLFPGGLAAQGDTPVLVGERIRVNQRGNLVAIGTVTAVSADSLFLLTAYDQPLSLRFDDVIRLDVSQGHQTRRGQGTALGACLGAATAMLLVGAMDAMTTGLTLGLAEDDINAPDYLIGAGIGAVFGGVVGGIVGNGHRTELWVQARLPGRSRPAAALNKASFQRY